MKGTMLRPNGTLAAPSIPARSPFSVIFSCSPSGSNRMASINPRIAFVAPKRLRASSALEGRGMSSSEIVIVSRSTEVQRQQRGRDIARFALMHYR